MENTKGPRAYQKGENTDKTKRAVVALLSCQPGRAATDNTSNSRKKKELKKKNQQQSGHPPTARGKKKETKHKAYQSWQTIAVNVVDYTRYLVVIMKCNF